MARTRANQRKCSPLPLMSWTRFHLPLEQEWPAWSVDHDDIHAGPLANVEGCQKLLLGRIVNNPKEAVYIIGK